MNTVLDICNLALEKLGEQHIDNVSPVSSPASRLCSLRYHPVRRLTLCQVMPGFAKKTAQLKSSYSSFQLPNDALRILNVSQPEWTLRGRSIYVGEKVNAINVEYIADVEDVSLFDDNFCDAFSTALAAELCMPLTGSMSMRQKLDSEYQSILNNK